MIDACIHLATIDDLHMQFDIVIFNYKHREQNMYSSVSVYKQQCSYLLMVLKICTGMYFMKTGKSNYSRWIEITYVIILFHHKRYHKHA